MEHFKRGQMIPKRLGIVTCHKKQRQHVKFGCSCLWDAKSRVMHSTDKDGCVFVVDWKASGIKVSNGTIKRKGIQLISFTDINFQR